MNVDSMKEVKKLAGQPWSAWKKILQEKKCSDLGIDKDKEMNKVSRGAANCMKLPRSDMALFGLCPKTELFELVVCNFCGNKYKLSAFAEHIKIRHSDNNAASPQSSINMALTDKNLQKKGKVKKTKEKIIKSKENNDSTASNTQINLDLKVAFMEIVSDKQPVLLESENSPQINVNLKKNLKVADSDNLLEEKKSSKIGNTCTLESDSIKAMSCSSSDDSSLLRPRSNVEGSTPPQGGEILNLQPVVQLTPLPPDSSTLQPTVNVSKPSEEQKTVKLLDIASNNTTKETFSSAGITPEVKQESGSSLQNSQFSNSSNRSLSSLSSKRGIVCAKPKAVGEFHKDAEKLSHSEVSSSLNLEKDRSQFSLNSGKAVKSHVLIDHKVNKTEQVKVDHKLVKRISNERPRLSLPVSIKNPTITNSILTQLQNKVLKLKFLSPVETTRNENIQEVIKENFVQKQIRNTRVHRSKENSRIQQTSLKKGGESETSDSKATENKAEGFTMWCPGFRRAGGLLYASHNLPCVSGSLKNVKSAVPATRKEEQTSSVNQTNISNSNKVIDLVASNEQNIADKIQIDIGSSLKRTPLPQKQKGPYLITNTKKGTSQQQQHKLIGSQAQNSNKTVICKRLNNNVNGIVPAKMRKQDGIINIVGSMFGKNDHKIPVMHVEVPNSVFEHTQKQIMAPSQHITTANTIDLTCSTVPAGVEIISGNIIRSSSIRIGAPRIHYFSSSGLLPATTNIQQVQLKPMRIPHKYQLLTPQINIAPSGGVYFLQKTTSNSTNMNGIEEK